MPGEYVLITGICGGLGRMLARRLHKSEKIIGIDRRPFPDRPKDILHFQIDIRRKKTDSIFKNYNIKAVYHLGVIHNPRQNSSERSSFNILGATKLLNYCEKYRIPKFIYLSTADVYGPGPENSSFLTEETPLLGWHDELSLRSAVETDILVQSFFWKAPDTDIVILRPVHIVGPGVKNAPTRFFNLKTVPVALGFNPMVQLIHQDDVIEAMALCLERNVRGIFNIEGPGMLPLREVLKALGANTINVPDILLKPALNLMWKWKLTDFPPGEMDFLRYICMVDGSRAKDQLGFKPKHDLKSTIACVSKRA